MASSMRQHKIKPPRDKVPHQKKLIAKGKIRYPAPDGYMSKADDYICGLDTALTLEPKSKLSQNTQEVLRGDLIKKQHIAAFGAKVFHMTLYKDHNQMEAALKYSKLARREALRTLLSLEHAQYEAELQKTGKKFYRAFDNF